MGKEREEERRRGEHAFKVGSHYELLWLDGNNHGSVTVCGSTDWLKL